MTKIADLPYDFKIGNRSAATEDRQTVIYNPQNDRILFDFDGVGGDKAVKIGKVTDSEISLSLLDYDVFFGDRGSLGQDPALILNLKNGNLLVDHDGAGGLSAKKIGFIDLDLLV